MCLKDTDSYIYYCAICDDGVCGFCVKFRELDGTFKAICLDHITDSEKESAFRIEKSKEEERKRKLAKKSKHVAERCFHHQTYRNGIGTDVCIACGAKVGSIKI